MRYQYQPPQAPPTGFQNQAPALANQRMTVPPTSMQNGMHPSNMRPQGPPLHSQGWFMFIDEITKST